MTMQRIVFLALLVALRSDQAESYTFPELNRRAMAGLWKLSKPMQPYPMKEFTVYPKPSAVSVLRAAEEYLIMLKEDGSFRQYSDGDEEERNRPRIIKRDIAEKTKEQTVMGLGFQNGTWDYVDGKLLLAAERPGGETNDTLLVGKVVATSLSSLVENPVAHDVDSSSTPRKPARDTHLSVPKGSVKIGKFFYPRHHPSFFEQPMYNPLSGDKFQLKQVLGMLNAAIEDEGELVEKFRRVDFANKKFLLTSHPIPSFKPKGEVRWSIKYNKFVGDPIKGRNDDDDDDDDKRPVNIRVMEVQLFANQTFRTTGGFGNAAILRGKWDIMGDKRDSLWLQVWRFGFGRSVSGSTYSEGQALTQDDAKMYWGKIGYVGDEEKGEGSPDQGNMETKSYRPLLQVKGSVVLGSGLEPQPVARFIMTEIELENDVVEDDDEEDTEVEEERAIERLENQNFDHPDEHGVDWSNSFQ